MHAAGGTARKGVDEPRQPPKLQKRLSTVERAQGLLERMKGKDPNGDPIRLEIDDMQSDLQRCAFKVVRHWLFEAVMSVIIMFNFGTILLEADMTAERANGDQPEPPAWIVAIGWAVLVIFVLELVLRVFVQRDTFIDDGWNNFDALVVVVDGAASIMGLILGSVFPVSALRILRLCKLARVSKIFRVFPELRLMMSGLVGAMRAIFWGMVLLLFALLVWAVIGVQFIHPLNLQIAKTGLYDDCERCARAYESVGSALVTLLVQNVAGDAWAEVTVPVIETYPVAAVYFIAVMMTVSMAVLNLILGVVVNIAMQSRDDMKAEMEKEKTLRRIEVHNSLKKVCDEMDTDGSGELSRIELLSGYKENEKFRFTLNELDIQEEDLEVLWTMLDSDKDGSVPYATFIHKSYSMKNSETQFMLAYIKFYVTRIKDQIVQILQQESEELEDIEKNAVLEQAEFRNEFAKIEQEEARIEQGIGVDNATPVANSQGKPKPDRTKAEVGPPAAAGVISPARLSADDRQVLDNLMETSRQWREELSVGINGINGKVDSILQDGSWAQVPRAITASEGNAPWCCSRNAAGSQQALEGRIAPSRGRGEDVVEPAGGRPPQQRQRSESGANVKVQVQVN